MAEIGKTKKGQNDICVTRIWYHSIDITMIFLAMLCHCSNGPTVASSKSGSKNDWRDLNLPVDGSGLKEPPNRPSGASPKELLDVFDKADADPPNCPSTPSAANELLEDFGDFGWLSEDVEDNLEDAFDWP